MLIIKDLTVPLDYTCDTLYTLAADVLKLKREQIEEVTLIKKAVNNKCPNNVTFKISLGVKVKICENFIWELKNKSIKKADELAYFVKPKPSNTRPIIVGLGPAGLFAALILAEAGAKPIVLERGLDVDNRFKSVQQFWSKGLLSPESNVQYGEGGAGAFSDGKLKPGKIDERKFKILSELVLCGAPPDIMYLEKPHIGTDRLRATVKNLRNKIISLGGEVIFSAKVTKLIKYRDKIAGVEYEKNGIIYELTSDNVILAIGHSARDTFNMLYEDKLPMEQRNFAVGVRIEHPSEYINKLKNGKFYNHPALDAADYKLVVHLPNSRGVYSFCMCPGGTVVAATSKESCVVTNGMSEYKRDGSNSNAALLVTLDKSDFESEHPLAGIALQEKIERSAFAAGGYSYFAPVQRLEDFMQGRETTAFGDVLPTYQPGTSFAPLESYLPISVCASLRQAIPEMNAWMDGYYLADAILTGPETRSTSPVRIIRDENMQAYPGLYPCGEGAGYAGGILSAAVDGVMCAEMILGKL